MIYANSGGAFPELYKALERLGYAEPVREKVIAFLDMETPVSGNAFEGVGAGILRRQYDHQFRTRIERAVRTEIMQGGDKALQNRYVHLAWLLAGSTCMPLLPIPLPQIREGLTAVYGDRADAMVLAMQASSLIRFGIPSLAAAELPLDDRVMCMEAARMCTANTPEEMLLCSAALECSDLPEKGGILGKLLSHKTDPLVQEAVERVENALSAPDDPDVLPYCKWTDILYRAAAAGAPFSQQLRKELETSNRFSARDVMFFALRIPIRPERIGDVLAQTAQPAEIGELISLVAAPASYLSTWNKYEPVRYKMLLTLCRRLPRQAAAAMMNQDTPAAAVYILKALKEAGFADERTEQLLHTALREKCARLLTASCNNMPGLEQYLLEGGSILPVMDGLLHSLDERSYYSFRFDYVSALGLDAFAKRVLCVQLLMGRYTHGCPGISSTEGKEAETVKLLKDEGIPAPVLVRVCASIRERETRTAETAFYTALADDAPEIAACGTDTFSVPARIFRIRFLHWADPALYKDAILAAAGDISKLVREALLELMQQHPEWHPEQLLTAKAVKVRETALAAVEAMGTGTFTNALEKALETEKSAALRKKISILLGMETGDAQVQQDITEELTKGGRAKKLAWLFEHPFSPVRMRDGSDAPEKLMQAFLLDYAGEPAFCKSTHCAFFTEKLDPSDTERFALEVFNRWLDAGAPAKQKWILCFSNAHGGERVLETTKRCIREWSEKARGAIAADAVRAMAYNDSPIALVTLDDYARTFKKAQVKEAAAGALREAARQLGLTTEELADKIVPDLGFNSRKQRVFDYGSRQFTVTLLPGMQLGIRCGDKSLRSLPKPGAKDDPALAEAAHKAFSDLKKQLRTVCKLQQQRMEYALLCGRTWQLTGWKELMLEKTVMHPLAETLVWGIYGETGLTDTFRYMDDGSFSDRDGDGFDLPAEGRIGLVHPLELTEDCLAAWKEQLEDFEITQPFPQIARTIYRVPEDKQHEPAYTGLRGSVINPLTLRGRMKKYGWATGQVLDGGFFEEFTRTDMTDFSYGQNGTPMIRGLGASLHFSGMDISGYFQEDVTIGTVEFYAIEENTRRRLELGDVPPRYYSEIIGQLEAAVRTNKEDA